MARSIVGLILAAVGLPILICLTLGLRWLLLALDDPSGAAAVGWVAGGLAVAWVFGLILLLLAVAVATLFPRSTPEDE